MQRGWDGGFGGTGIPALPRPLPGKWSDCSASVWPRCFLDFRNWVPQYRTLRNQCVAVLYLLA